MAHYIDSIVPQTQTLTEREQRLLLKTTGEHVRGFRDHLIYSFALATALREHEIVALNVGDVLHAGRVRRRVKLRVFKRSAKEPAIQEVVLANTLRAKLERFIAWKRRQGQSVASDAPLFLSRHNRRLSERQVRHSFGVWQERAGFERHFHFHQLRHSSCTNIYRATRDLRLTQRFARHKSVRTTTRYTHPSDEELAQSVDGLIC